MAQTTMASFQEYLTNSIPGRNLQIDASWGQGRTIFGGLSAAILVRACASKVDDSFSLRNLSVTFPAALLGEESFQIVVEDLAKGKSAHQLQARLVQNDKICTLVTACFAKDRNGSINHSGKSKATLPPRTAEQKFPFIKNLTPEFTQHFHIFLTEGQMPFSGNNLRNLSGWMSFREDQGQLSAAHVLALIDAWPPVPLQNYKKPGPSSTITWSLDFMDYQGLARDWLYFDGETVAAANGYAQTQAHIFDQKGDLIAVSRQLVGLYD